MSFCSFRRHIPLTAIYSAPDSCRENA